MSDLPWERIKAEMLRGLQHVAKCFEEDPTPTDGSFDAACKKLGIRSSVRVYRPSPEEIQAAKRIRPK
jgi:aspartate carbamoyltransferase catalytic subunit